MAGTNEVKPFDPQSWNELRDYLDDNFSQPNWVFRGEPECYESVKPVIDRHFHPEETFANRLSLEQRAMTWFVQDAAMHLDDLQRSILREGMQAQVVMRHYGAPTRLLDWTESQWIALFFSCWENPTRVGRLLAFSRSALQEKVGSQFSEESQAHGTLSETNIGLIPQLLLPSFADKAHDWVVCYHRHDEKFARLVLQQGLFTLGSKPNLDHWKVVNSLIPNIPKSVHISPQLKMEVLQRLDRMGISAATLFPGVEGVAKRLNNVVQFNARA